MDTIIQKAKSRPFFQKYKEFFSEAISFVAIIVFVVIPIRVFIAQPFRVSGESMINTFQNKDYLIVDQISYRFIAPKRGDVIVLKHPDSEKYLIKRIIALPGETVTLSGQITTIKNSEHPDGIQLDETFLDNPSDDGYQEYIVPVGYYFVMGDNRPYSSDSRSWGLLPRDHVVGRTLLRLYPFNNIDLFPGFVDTY